MPAEIDPPEGWRYGFPKPAPADALSGPFLARLPEWLIENGYPAELIELYDAARNTRIIGEFADEQTDLSRRVIRSSELSPEDAAFIERHGPTADEIERDIWAVENSQPTRNRPEPIVSAGMVKDVAALTPEELDDGEMSALRSTNAPASARDLNRLLDPQPEEDRRSDEEQRLARNAKQIRADAAAGTLDDLTGTRGKNLIDRLLRK
jgi:hypothetical protein